MPSSTLETTYNDIGKISMIEQDDYQTTFSYGPDHERWRSCLTDDGNTVRTVLYGGDYERVVVGDTVREFYYPGHGIIVMKQGSTFTVCVAATDALGSILRVTDAQGDVLYSAYYDAWGVVAVDSNKIAFNRGYTGHEMLPEYGLINMDGRLYDPQIGRFLSPDNYVQLPDLSQSFNRYSYCLNNPLKYTDPDGEWLLIDDVIAMIVGGVLNTGSNLLQGNIHNVWQGVTLFAVGAAAGEAALYTGAAAPFVSAAIISVGNDITNQGFTSGLSGIDWNRIFSDFVISEVAAGFSVGLGAIIGPQINGFVNDLGIKSPVLNKMFTNALFTGGSGALFDGGLTLANGGSLKDAGNAALRSGTTGFVSGAISGFVEGLKYSRDNQINPWTGKSNYQDIIDALGLQPTVDRINNNQELPQYPHDGAMFQNREGLPIGNYREWVVPSPNLPSHRPGPQRILSSDRYWYYSPDHYRTFIRIK